MIVVIIVIIENGNHNDDNDNENNNKNNNTHNLISIQINRRQYHRTSLHNIYKGRQVVFKLECII